MKMKIEEANGVEATHGLELAVNRSPTAADNVKAKISSIIVQPNAVASNIVTQNPIALAKEQLSLYGKKKHIDFKIVNELSLIYVNVLLAIWLPDGQLKGDELVSLNPTRSDNDEGSFSINVVKGCWAEFAEIEDTSRGGDLISLGVYLHGYTRLQSAIEILKIIVGLKTDDVVLAVESKKMAKADTAKAKLTAIMPIPETAMTRRPTSFYDWMGSLTGTWDYRNAQGDVMFFVHRFDMGNGSKSYRPQTYCQDADGFVSWQFQAPPTPRPAYGLDRLAAIPDALVLFAEGEKSADAAQRLFPDFVAVTTMNGSQSPEKTDFTPFAGRKVLIAPDNDEAGEGYVSKLKTLLAGVGAVVVAVMRLAKLAKGDAPLAKKYDLADAEVDGWTAEALAALGDDLWEPVMLETDPEEDLSEVEMAGNPASATYKIGEFTVNRDGVFYDKIVKENVQVVRISSRIDVVARTCSANNDQWGSILEFKDPDGNAKRWALSTSMLSGNAEDVRKVILGMGAMIESGMAERGKFTSYLMTCDPSARALCVTQPGWHQAGDQQVYVTNDSAIGKTDLQIVLQTANPKAFEIFKKKGTVDDWKMHVANRCAGNSRLVMATCAALSAPVLHLMSLENMGLHFFGSSSIGKTIALKVAASVWGGGTIIQTWRATSNGLEAIASRHNDGLLCLDEMGQVNGKEVGETAYMLGNGQGKLRATIEAEAKDVRKFRLVYISNGEVAMRDHMQAAGKKVMAGQEVRLLNIPADAGAGFGIFDNITGSQNSGDYANEISRDALRYHGHAGLAFVEALSDAEQQGALLDSIREKQLQFIQAYTPASADGQVGRVGQKFAFMAAVGEVCAELGILPWGAGEAIAGARRCYMDWIEQRGGVSSLEEEQVVEQVRKYLEQHGESRFTRMGTQGLADDTSVKTINRAGFRESTNDERTEYFVLPEVFKSEICAGLNPTYVSKVLADRGFLAVGKDGKPQVAKRLPSMGIKRVYRILPSIMGDDISEPEAVVSEPAAVVSIEASVSEMAKRYIV